MNTSQDFTFQPIDPEIRNLVAECIPKNLLFKTQDLYNGKIVIDYGWTDHILADIPPKYHKDMKNRYLRINEAMQSISDWKLADSLEPFLFQLITDKLLYQMNNIFFDLDQQLKNNGYATVNEMIQHILGIQRSIKQFVRTY